MGISLRRLRFVVALTTVLILALSVLLVLPGSAGATSGSGHYGTATTTTEHQDGGDKCDEHHYDKDDCDDHEVTTTTVGDGSTTTKPDHHTTTTQATTTTTQATTTTTIVGIVPSTVPEVVGGITVTTSSIPSDGSSVLPFTGVDRGKLIALGTSALVLGLLLVAGARREET